MMKGVGMARRKRGEEAKIERLTWALMVAWVIITIPETVQVPVWAIAGVCGAILMSSGIYQSSKRWDVFPITWIGSTVLLGLAGGAYIWSERFEFFVIPITLAMIVIVILMGIFAGDT
jgi:hypothetical protein